MAQGVTLVDKFSARLSGIAEFFGKITGDAAQTSLQTVPDLFKAWCGIDAGKLCSSSGFLEPLAI